MTRPAEPDCPRLDAELVHVSRARHATKAEIKRRKADHRAQCPVCRGWTVPPNLSRDPERTP